MEALEAKLIILFALLVSSLISSLVPFKLIKRFDGSTFLAIMNSIAGGVFLGTTFLELIPEVREGFEDYFNKLNTDMHYPWSEFTICVGFFLVLIIETLAHVVFVRNVETENHVCCEKANPESSQSLLSDNKASDYGTLSDSQTLADSNNASSPSAPPQQSYCVEERKAPSEFTNEQDHQALIRDCVHHAQSTDNQIEDVDVPATTPLVPSTDASLPKIHNMRGFLLLFALSIHTIFEGLALGLKTSSEMSSLWSLFAGVILHKCVIAFSLGSHLAENINHKILSLLAILLFCIMSPLGIVIGIMVQELQDINETGSQSQITSNVLQAIATGTFIYITFFEILDKEIIQKKNFLNILIVILGFSATALITLLH